MTLKCWIHVANWEKLASNFYNNLWEMTKFLIRIKKFIVF